jgi:hypothetical protein
LQMIYSFEENSHLLQGSYLEGPLWEWVQGARVFLRSIMGM